MTVTDEITECACDQRSQTGSKLRMLDQMAEALEDQVAALYRRAASASRRRSSCSAATLKRGRPRSTVWCSNSRLCEPSARPGAGEN